MAFLIGMSAEVKGNNHNLDRDRVSIGRNSTNLITVEHPTVSGRHCTIVREDKRYRVQDLGSTNGTRVNGKDIDDSPLRPKDLLQIGSVEFMFDAEESEWESDTPKVRSEANVEVSNDPTVKPISFGSISPFGPRSRGNTKMWYVLIGVIGVLALGLVAAVLFMLLT